MPSIRDPFLYDPATLRVESAYSTCVCWSSLAFPWCQIAIHHNPRRSAYFQIAAPSAFETGVALLAGLIPVTLIELSKLVRRSPSSMR